MFTLESSGFKIQSTPDSASDCAQYSRNVILDAANEYNLDISRGGQHFEIMMEAYNAIYLDYYSNL